MSLLQSLASAHERHEGWFAGSLSQRNRNPGNLRLTNYQRKAYGAVAGDKGFAKFPSYEAGFQALMDDIRAKIMGGSAHINYQKNPTLLDYVKVYAPASDGNDPVRYAWALCQSLAPAYALTPKTPLTELARIIIAEESAPRSIVFSSAAQVKRLARAVSRTTGAAATLLAKRLKRLKNRLS